MLSCSVKIFILIQCFFYMAMGNLEGPFVFWGPKELSGYRRPALTSLEQDDLLDIYNNQAAIVVFNIQDSLFFLTRENYPRLRKLLERKTVLFVPQDFLDIHPEYVNNETQVITVQGPNSEQDAEITEKFERLEDVYGEGKVLAILGSSSPEEEPIEEDMDMNGYSNDVKYIRERREATEEPREAPFKVWYNAAGQSLLYSGNFPILLTYYSSVNGSTHDVYKLRKPLSETGDDRGQLSRLIITFSTAMGKVTLRFRFLDNQAGYWSIGSVELVDSRGEYILNPPNTNDFLGAPKGFSFICGEPLVFTNGQISLTFQEIQVQPFLGGANRFGSAYNCVGFTTIPIWSGILVTSLLLLGVSIAILMISDIKTMDRFENSKGKGLTFTISE